MIRHNEKSLDKTTNEVNNSSNNNVEANQLNGQTSAYTLYLEHLGGFLPLLKGEILGISEFFPISVTYRDLSQISLCV